MAALSGAGGKSGSGQRRGLGGLGGELRVTFCAVSCNTGQHGAWSSGAGRRLGGELLRRRCLLAAPRPSPASPRLARSVWQLSYLHSAGTVIQACTAATRHARHKATRDTRSTEPPALSEQPASHPHPSFLRLSLAISPRPGCALQHGSTPCHCTAQPPCPCRAHCPLSLMHRPRPAPWPPRRRARQVGGTRPFRAIPLSATLFSSERESHSALAPKLLPLACRFRLATLRPAPVSSSRAAVPGFHFLARTTMGRQKPLSAAWAWPRVRSAFPSWVPPVRLLLLEHPRFCCRAARLAPPSLPLFFLTPSLLLLTRPSYTALRWTARGSSPGVLSSLRRRPLVPRPVLFDISPSALPSNSDQPSFLFLSRLLSFSSSTHTRSLTSTPCSTASTHSSSSRRSRSSSRPRPPPPSPSCPPTRPRPRPRPVSSSTSRAASRRRWRS